VEEEAPRAVGADDPRLRLDQRRPALGQHDPVRPWLDLVPGDAALLELGGGALIDVREALDEPVELEQRLPRLRLELAPRRRRVARLPDPGASGVRESEDPGRPVARAAVVVEPELLVDDDVVPRPRKRPGRGGAHDPGSDDRHAHAAYPHRSRRSIPGRATGSAAARRTTSAGGPAIRRPPSSCSPRGWGSAPEGRWSTSRPARGSCRGCSCPRARA